MIQKGAIIRAGITVDQVIANRIGQDTPQPSLVLACEQPMTGYHETNFSMAYSSHISWQSPDSPVPNEVYPSLAWDSLFENRGSLRQHEHPRPREGRGRGAAKQISSGDKAKLDEYLTSVREVEKRVERMRKSQRHGGRRARRRRTAPRSRWTAPANGLPEDLREHMPPDVRHHRHRVPDRQDAHRHAAARARSLGAVLSVPRCRATATTPRRTTTTPTVTSASPAST